jgi:hypothetical protein
MSLTALPEGLLACLLQSFGARFIINFQRFGHTLTKLSFQMVCASGRAGLVGVRVIYLVCRWCMCHVTLDSKGGTSGKKDRERDRKKKEGTSKSNPDTQTTKHRYKKHRHIQIHKHEDKQAHKRSEREKKKNKRTAIITQGKKRDHNNNDWAIKKRIYSSVRTHI